eukprot:gnl/TRDRNA2_/TRDRNA2_35771_c0_seq1.p1 gnl/TRDRNA2_/TRDRNA2_35771_c0~~gnl/TRDRNA2_/TRDRNA2_35771_c0_seq1.p1  ORF type:complete len:310 (-),score=70.63 gnl/TRDRNA2_/TRDRNA2_35771_c0_seq1:148-1026(-)
MASIVVTKMQFLARSPLAMRSIPAKKPDATSAKEPAEEVSTDLVEELQKLKGKLEAAAAISELPPQLPPPPGLAPERKPGTAAEDLAVATAARAALSKVDAPVSSPELLFLVLLRGLPEVMTHEVVVRTMMEQASVDEGLRCIHRFAGCDQSWEVLVVFSSSAWAIECVQYFQGRWAESGLALTAKVVGSTVQLPSAMRPKTDGMQKRATMSAKAPAFVPPSMLSAQAPVFVPKAKSAISLDSLLFVPGKLEQRPRFYSDASTESGQCSDEALSCSEDEDWMQEPMYVSMVS